MGYVNPDTGVFHRSGPCAGEDVVEMSLASARDGGFDACGICCDGTFEKRTMDDILDDDLENLTSRELRLRISKHVGILGPFESFGKADLNAIYHHITGEHYFPKRDLGTPVSPRLEDIRIDLSIKADIDGYAAPGDPTSGRRPFRNSELAQLCEAVEKTGETYSLEEMEA